MFLSHIKYVEAMFNCTKHYENYTFFSPAVEKIIHVLIKSIMSNGITGYTVFQVDLTGAGFIENFVDKL